MHIRFQNKAEFKWLQDEVVQGESCLFLNNQGNLARLSRIAVLRAVRPDGSVLMTIAKWQGEHIRPAFWAPAAKMMTGELPRDAILRMLKSGKKTYDLYSEFLDVVQGGGEVWQHRLPCERGSCRPCTLIPLPKCQLTGMCSCRSSSM